MHLSAYSIILGQVLLSLYRWWMTSWGKRGSGVERNDKHAQAWAVQGWVRGRTLILRVVRLGQSRDGQPLGWEEVLVSVGH